MEEIGQQSRESARPGWRYRKFAGVFLLVIVFAVGGFFIWNKYLSPEAQKERELRRNYELATKAINTYEEAMRNDTYGGKTPEETLLMFIEALQKEDIELASKYFVLKSDGQIDQKWVEGLRKSKEDGQLPGIIDILSQAKPDEAAAISGDYYVFSVRDKKGDVIADVDLHLNNYSGIWKIESL